MMQSQGKQNAGSPAAWRVYNSARVESSGNAQLQATTAHPRRTLSQATSTRKADSLRRIQGVAMAIDPVCQMEVDEKRAPARSTYENKTYYFCSNQCKESFEEDPEEFISSAA